jgi:archaellin
MKAKELAELLMKTPDLDVVIYNDIDNRLSYDIKLQSVAIITNGVGENEEREEYNDENIKHLEFKANEPVNEDKLQEHFNKTIWAKSMFNSLEEYINHVKQNRKYLKLQLERVLNTQKSILLTFNYE